MISSEEQHYRFEASNLFSHQLFGVGTHLQIRLRVQDSAETAFAVGLQSVCEKSLNKSFYSPQIEKLNKFSINQDVYHLRFSLNMASEFESPHLNHPAHSLRKHMQRQIMDCPLPRDTFKFASNSQQKQLDLFEDATKSSDGSSDNLSSSNEKEAKDESWKLLEIIWVSDKITFLLDGKVFREFG